MPVDDVLVHYAETLPARLGSSVRYSSFARWMDDIWLFLRDAGQARRAQIDLQATAQALGLNLNSAKTELLEGQAVYEHAREIEHSAVDDALDADHPDMGPLENLIDKILDKPDTTSRTTIKFAATRMRVQGSQYRIHELLEASKRMPHGSDAWSPLFKAVFVTGGLQDWFLDYCKSDWAAFEWSVSQYGRMFGSAKAPKKKTKEFFAEIIDNPGASLPALALASQRLAVWDPTEYRAVVRSAIRNAANPQARRVLALSALEAGEGRGMVRRWLGHHPDNDVTLRMLEETSFHPPKIVADYAN
jgi:hypothetical protein